MILITGAAGFIGSAVAHALAQRSDEGLVLVDRFGSADKWKNLCGVDFHQFVDRGQLFDALKRDAWASKVSTVIHMGACADTTIRDVDYLMEWNVEFSRRLAEWTLAQNARFVYASSAAVYGDGSRGFSDEDALTPDLRPLNPYGFSKLLFDRMVLERGWQKRVAGLRFFNVYGPNEYHKGRMASVVMHAYPQARDRGVVRLFESHRPDIAHGEQRRDFIYIDEVLKGVLFLAEKPQINGIFNLGTGRAHTYNQLAENVCLALRKPVRIEYFPMPEDLRDRYQYETCADMTKFYAAGLPAFTDDFSRHVQTYVRDYLHAGMKHLAD